MATTVYGCVNRTTGQAEFDVCGTGDFKGCVERTGIHAGQVKVIISGKGCDDTYYGCVNRDTGKFQVIVPDDCCAVSCENCSGATPIIVEVIVSDTTPCDMCVDRTKVIEGSVDGSYYIQQVSGDPCKWYGEFNGYYGHLEAYMVEGCSVMSDEYDLTALYVLVDKSSVVTPTEVIVKILVFKDTVGEGGWLYGFYGTAIVSEDCVNVSVDNLPLCASGPQVCESGTAVVSDYSF